jgi:hypothetical protein
MAEGNENITSAEPVRLVSDSELLASLAREMGEKPKAAGEAGEEDSTGETPEDIAAQGDKGHGDEVIPEETEEESAGGENAGDEEQDEAEVTEGESETADAQETESEGEEEKQPKGIREMQKRIDTLTARSKTLEEQNTELKAQLEGAHPVLPPTLEDPLSNCNHAQEVIDRVQAMGEVRDWCVRNWDGGEYETKDGQTKELSASEVRERYVRSSAIVEKYGPARIQFLELRRQYDAVAREIYPALFDANSQESQVANAFLRQNPGIARLPQYVLIIGDALAGQRIREEKLKARQGAPGKKPTSGQVVTKMAPRPIRPAGAKPVRTNGADQLLAKYQNTLSDRDLERYLEATL